MSDIVNIKIPYSTGYKELALKANRLKAVLTNY